MHEIKGPDGEWLSYQVAEITAVRDLTGWPEGMRLIVRRVKPSRRDQKKLTALENRTGWRYQIVATKHPRPPRALRGARLRAGLVHRLPVPRPRRGRGPDESDQAGRTRTAAQQVPQLNAAWVLAATLAADLDAWTRLLVLHDEPDLAKAEPETIRMKLYHLPARLTAHARRRTLHLNRTWPWATASTTAWRHATELPALT